MKEIIEKVCSWIQNHIPTDKMLHFMAGFVVFFLVSLSVFAIGNIKWVALLFGTIATVSIAICKEDIDVECGGKFDIWDFLSTLVGGAFSSLIFLTL